MKTRRYTYEKHESKSKSQENLYFELIENRTYQNLWDAAKVVLKKDKGSKLNHLSFLFKKLK